MTQSSSGFGCPQPKALGPTPSLRRKNPLQADEAAPRKNTDIRDGSVNAQAQLLMQITTGHLQSGCRYMCVSTGNSMYRV